VLLTYVAAGQGEWSVRASSAPQPAIPWLHPHRNIEWIEKETVRRTLERSAGVKKAAAELMGISAPLSYYLAKYRLD
jgi:transcriptional regulator with PAS, ATPase and Fis domain